MEIMTKQAFFRMLCRDAGGYRSTEKADTRVSGIRFCNNSVFLLLFVGNLSETVELMEAAERIHLLFL